jgi:3-oxoadipate enol-lactonase
MPWVRANGVDLFYRMDGTPDGPALLLSHSLGMDLAMWAPQLQVFGERFRVVRYDGRNHGRSAVVPGACSMEDLGRDALALLDALHLKRVHFCGLSQGGMVGMWLSSHAPERVDRLVLCNTAAQMDASAVWNARIEAVRRGGMEAVAEGVLERWFTAGFRARRPDVIAAARRTLVATDPDGYVACCGAIRDQDQRASLPSIRAPTLVIAGRFDAATPPAKGHAIAEAIPGARLVELDTAHISNLEVPEEFGAAVAGFLFG